MEKYAEGGWVTGTKYEDELRDMLKERTAGKDDQARSIKRPCVVHMGSCLFIV